ARDSSVTAYDTELPTISISSRGCPGSSNGELALNVNSRKTSFEAIVSSYSMIPALPPLNPTGNVHSPASGGETGAPVWFVACVTPPAELKLMDQRLVPRGTPL